MVTFINKNTRGVAISCKYECSGIIIVFKISNLENSGNNVKVRVRRGHKP